MMGSGIPKMGVGCFWRLYFGGGFGGKFWRVYLAGGVAAPPRAPRARKNGFFCHFCQKSGLFLSSFVKNSSKISQSE